MGGDVKLNISHSCFDQTQGKQFKTISSLKPSTNMTRKEHRILIDFTNKEYRVEEVSFQVPGETFPLDDCRKQDSELRMSILGSL